MTFRMACCHRNQGQRLRFPAFSSPGLPCAIQGITRGLLILLPLTLATFISACGGGGGGAPIVALESRTLCTPGTDCYCDRVRTVTDPLYDPSLLFCEDFEAPTLYLDQGLGDGAPYFGPWYDETGSPGNRGNNSYWAQTYGNGVGDYLWETGTPIIDPALGDRCTIAGGCTVKSWDGTNRWSANAHEPLLGIMIQGSDFSAEVAAITAPTNTVGGAPGVFDGNANLAFRIPPGGSGGIAGKADFPDGTPLDVTRTIGLTMAISYPDNALSAGIIGKPGGDNLPWKHNEWETEYGPSFDGLFVFYNGGSREKFPFAGFIGSFEDQNDTNCGAANTTVGQTSCLGTGLGINWSAEDEYDQATDFPMGTWGCVRGFIENAGTINQRFRVWFQGPNMASERLIVDFEMDATLLDNKDGYSGMAWNAFSNANQDPADYTTQTTFRYEDNVHARAGMPVSCKQIGFGGP
jgi:hypothetical protein